VSAAFSKQNRRSRAKSTPTGHDVGPSLLERPSRDADGAELRGARTERAERWDPDNPNLKIRAGRRLDPLRTMAERGHLSRAQWQTVERFRDDLDLADGARIGPGEVTYLWHPSGGVLTPSDRQLDAVERVRGALAAAGLAAIAIINFLIVEGRTLTEFCAVQRIGDRRAAEMLKTAIDKIDVYYQGVKTPLDT